MCVCVCIYIYIYIHRSLARGCLCVQSQARIMCTGSVAKSLLMSARGHSESRQRARTRVCVAREFQKAAKRHKGLCSDEVTVTSERHAPAETTKKEERKRGTHWGLRQRPRPGAWCLIRGRGRRERVWITRAKRDFFFEKDLAESNSERCESNAPRLQVFVFSTFFILESESVKMCSK